MRKSTAKAIVTRLCNAVVNARPRLTAWSEEHGRFGVNRSVGTWFIRRKRVPTGYRFFVRILVDPAVAARFQERSQYFRRQNTLWAGKVMMTSLLGAGMTRLTSRPTRWSSRPSCLMFVIMRHKPRALT